jgi:broad specificity phosphatase PhoE
MKIYFVRHGETDMNVRNMFYGWYDADINAKGVMQAEELREAFRHIPIDAIYSSDLTRAIQTAQPTADQRNLTVMIDARLREIHGGDWQGRPGAVIAEMYPESHTVWKKDIENSCPGGVESYRQVSDRMHEFFEEILKKHRGECVAVFSHALSLHTMAKDWVGKEKSPWVSNASISILEYEDDGRCHVKLYSYDEHHGKDVTALSKGLTS